MNLKNKHIFNGNLKHNNNRVKKTQKSVLKITIITQSLQKVKWKSNFNLNYNKNHNKPN